MINKAIFHKAPLAPNAFAPLPTGAIKPLGFLLKWERALAQGLTGQATQVWDSLKDNAWMGGDGEGWERGPYYLDGLLPLAYQLADDKLIALANRFIDWTLDSQREDGFFGPEGNTDWWPRMVMLKCMIQHFTATGDKRVLPFMMKYCEFMYKNLEQNPLGLWAIARAGDNIQSILWLYNITGQKVLLRLCDLLLRQSIDWTGFFHAFPAMRDTKRDCPWSELKTQIEASDDPWSDGWHKHQTTHVVNVAMGLKTPMLSHALHGGLKEAQAFDAGYTKLMRHHGVATGMFTGDEHLSGANPSQGTETCAVVETLYSLESLMALTHDAAVGDIFERIGYNALPAALSEDGWAHQYDQQVNQIHIDNSKHGWYNNDSDANVFGLEPNFGCCTANLHQGYPKFVGHLWMATASGGLVAQSYAPCTVDWICADTRIKLTVEEGYPQTENIHIRLSAAQSATFTIQLRIPNWTQDAYARVGEKTYPAKPGSFLSIEREWQDGDTIDLHISQEVVTQTLYHQTIAVTRGPILYAYPVPMQWEYQGELPLCDRHAHPTAPWNYALLPEYGFSTIDGGAAIEAMGFICPDWLQKDGDAGSVPVLPVCGTAQKVRLRLIPYANAPLRIAQFPHGRG